MKQQKPSNALGVAAVSTANGNESSSVLTLPLMFAYLRKRAGLSARALSDLAGFSPSYVGKVEAGEVSPSFSAFCELARALNLTDAEIIFLVRHVG